MLLPYIEKADIAVTKLTSYVLNAYHPEGRHKARVFLSALAVTTADAKWLADTILSGLWLSETVLQTHTNWGQFIASTWKLFVGSGVRRSELAGYALPNRPS